MEEPSRAWRYSSSLALRYSLSTNVLQRSTRPKMYMHPYVNNFHMFYILWRICSFGEPPCNVPFRGTISCGCHAGIILRIVGNFLAKMADVIMQQRPPGMDMKLSAFKRKQVRLLPELPPSNLRGRGL